MTLRATIFYLKPTHYKLEKRIQVLHNEVNHNGIIINIEDVEPRVRCLLLVDSLNSDHLKLEPLQDAAMRLDGPRNRLKPSSYVEIRSANDNKTLLSKS